jgi:hypothetical protein
MMTTDLVPLPEIPAGLRQAALVGKLIPFVGAGTSQLAGCPGWNDFANAALSQLIDKGKFTHAQFDQIKHLSPRIKLSIAKTVATGTKTPIDFDRILHSNPKSDHQKGRRLYKSLFALGSIFVTTNYDRWLDEQLIEPSPAATPAVSPVAPSPIVPIRSIYEVSNFLPAALTQPNTVVHLHGSVADPRGMVLTTHDYIRLYANDHRTGDATNENRTLTFLEHLFEHHTVLFVGYGLEELEILEYVILKARRQTGVASNEARHFLLQGFFSHETTVLRSMETYYLTECGIQLIPFLRDQKGWDQLLDVLENFAQRMPTSTPLALQQAQILETLAGEMEPLQ